MPCGEFLGKSPKSNLGDWGSEVQILSLRPIKPRGYGVKSQLRLSQTLSCWPPADHRKRNLRDHPRPRAREGAKIEPLYWASMWIAAKALSALQRKYPEAVFPAKTRTAADGDGAHCAAGFATVTALSHDVVARGIAEASIAYAGDRNPEATVNAKSHKRTLTSQC